MTEATLPIAAAGLFQKAHGKIILLSRLDSQLTTLMGQRKRVQEELNEVQSLIDGEFKRIMHDSDELPAKVLSGIIESEPVAVAGRVGE